MARKKAEFQCRFYDETDGVERTVFGGLLKGARMKALPDGRFEARLKTDNKPHIFRFISGPNRVLNEQEEQIEILTRALRLSCAEQQSELPIAVVAVKFIKIAREQLIKEGILREDN